MAIQSVKRATDIISLFTASRTALGITQIAAALNLNKATAWGLVTTLQQQGFLQQDPDTQKYSVGSRLFELGMVYVGSLEINSKASRHAHDLASRVGLNARVGIWDRGSVLITLLAMPKAQDSLSHQIGPRVPAYCSGIGKALLAFMPPAEIKEYLENVEMGPGKGPVVKPEVLLEELEQTRARGYSMITEEMIPGVSALGAPIFGRQQTVVGGISIAYPPSAMTGKELDTLGGELLRAAAEISREMGFYKSF